MAKLTDADLRGILNSDFALWERASAGALTPEKCEEFGIPPETQGIIKEIEAPCLGGMFRVIYGSNEKGNVEAFGAAVRAHMEDIRSEQEERAARKRMQDAYEAQNPSPEADSDPAGTGSEGRDTKTTGGVQAPTEKAVPPSVPAPEAGQSFADRRDVLARSYSELQSFIAEATTRKKQVIKELRAIEAALEIMNASEDDGAEQTDVPTETQEPGTSS